MTHCVFQAMWVTGPVLTLLDSEQTSSISHTNLLKVLWKVRLDELSFDILPNADNVRDTVIQQHLQLKKKDNRNHVDCTISVTRSVWYVHSRD